MNTQHPGSALAHPAGTTAEPTAELVWQSPLSGEALLGGKAMTQQRAIHVCLTHSRNEIDQSQTDPTRITYRTPGGSACVYEGARPAPAYLIPSQPHPSANGVRRVQLLARIALAKHRLLRLACALLLVSMPLLGLAGAVMAATPVR
jgi:hypothetical protein